MTTCNFCDNECRCHISPPCGFCTSHTECEMCGQLVCLDKTEELTDKSDGTKLLVCPDCIDRMVD